MVFIILKRLCSYHRYLIWEHFHQPPKKFWFQLNTSACHWSFLIPWEQSIYSKLSLENNSVYYGKRRGVYWLWGVGYHDPTSEKPASYKRHTVDLKALLYHLHLLTVSGTSTGCNSWLFCSLVMPSSAPSLTTQIHPFWTVRSIIKNPCVLLLPNYFCYCPFLSILFLLVIKQTRAHTNFTVF